MEALPHWHTFFSMCVRSCQRRSVLSHFCISVIFLPTFVFVDFLTLNVISTKCMAHYQMTHNIQQPRAGRSYNCCDPHLFHSRTAACGSLSAAHLLILLPNYTCSLLPNYLTDCRLPFQLPTCLALPTFANTYSIWAGTAHIQLLTLLPILKSPIIMFKKRF